MCARGRLIIHCSNQVIVLALSFLLDALDIPAPNKRFSLSSVSCGSKHKLSLISASVTIYDRCFRAPDGDTHVNDLHTVPLFLQTVQPVGGGQRRLVGQHDPLRAQAQLLSHGGTQVRRKDTVKYREIG